MKKPQVPDKMNRDFEAEVQKRLIEPLKLDDVDVVIHVDRHQGKNGNVEVTFPNCLGDQSPADRSSPDSLHDDAVSAQKQLSFNQLRFEIKNIVDCLLEDCAVQFGDVTFFIKRGKLEETVFSFSTKPHESSARFFVVKV